MGCGASTQSSSVVPPAQQEFNAIEDSSRAVATAAAVVVEGRRPSLATARPPLAPPTSAAATRQSPTSIQQQQQQQSSASTQLPAAAAGTSWEQAKREEEEQARSSQADSTVHGGMAAMQHLHVRLSALPSAPCGGALASTPGPIPSDSPAIHATHPHARPHALRALGAPRATSPSPYSDPRPASATEEDFSGPPRPSPLNPKQERDDAHLPSSLQPSQSEGEQGPASPLQPAQSEAEDVLTSQPTPPFMMHAVPKAKGDASRYEASSLTDDDDDDDGEGGGSGRRAGFDLQHWHTFFRQNRTKHAELLDFLWKRFDPAHHSMFALTYKAQDQILASFQGDNVVHGFCCRVESSGVELFGLMHTLSRKGVDGFKVLGIFIVSGQDPPAGLSSTAESEHFQLLKADTSDPLVRQFVGQLLVGTSPTPDMSVVSSRQLQQQPGPPAPPP